MKRLLIGVAIIAAILVLLVAALPFFVNANQFRPLLETKLTKALGRPVKLGELKLSIFSGGVTASEVSIGDDPKFSPGPFLSAQALTVGVDLPALIFSRELHVKRISIDQPDITLLENPMGAWNFSTLGSATTTTTPSSSNEAALDLSVKVLNVTNGKIVLGRTESKMKPEVFEKVDIQVQDFAPSAVFPFSLSADGSGGAIVKLDGKAGPLNSADASATPLEATINVTHLDLAHSGFLPATGFAGVVSLNGNLSSTGTQAHIKGSFQAEQLVLARRGTPAKRTVSFDFDLQHDMQKHAGTLDQGALHIGAAQASFTGSYDREGDATVLKVKLSGPAMPIPDLEAMLPALDIILPAGSSFQGGTASANVTISGPTDRMVLDGTLGLNNTKLAGFDLGSKLAFMARLAGINEGSGTEIQSMSMNIHIDPAGVRTENLSLVAPQIGDVTGAGTVSASHALDFNMIAKVRTGGLLAVMGPNTTVPFKIEGTSSAPRFDPDTKGIVADKLKQLGGSDVQKAATGLLKGFLGGKK
ncbi:MAG TPA: AsmA family protein [Bryobacteraceae bacterium]|nr:AsmA family protein [Bryobacteraceae bacterium]